MKRIICIILSVFSIIFLQACSEENKEEDTTVDIDSRHIQLELTDKVHIDADITPYDKYKEGLASYYIESYVDMSGVLDEESLVENAQFFKQDISSVIESIEDNTDGSFDVDNMKIVFDTDYMECEFNIKHTDREGIERALAYIWYLDDVGNAYSPEVWFDCRNGELEATSTEHFLGKHIKKYVPECLGEDLSFAKAEAAGELWKSTLEKIMGEELSDNYIIVPVSEENYNALLEKRESEEAVFDEEFYQFFFFRSVDGISWKRLDYSIPVESAGELAEGIERQILGNNLMSSDEWPLIVDVDKNGIRFLELTANSVIDEVYKEKANVIDVNQLIKKVKEFFSLSYMVNDITIYNIELCYSSSFSDKEDGPVRNIVTPYWIVDYSIDKSSGDAEAYRIVYDAYTGEFIMEKEAVE